MTDANAVKKRSKFLSLVLRHQPEKIGLALDPNGWAEVDELLRLLAKRGRPLTRDEPEEVVEKNDKHRFSFDETGSRIRANQGHSVKIDLGLEPVEPPETLHHGTATRHLDSIRELGLIPGSRRHVHLSPDRETALRVGQRHGKPAVLDVLAKEASQAGVRFYLAANGVWLAEAVPARFLVVPDTESAKRP